MNNKKSSILGNSKGKVSIVALVVLAVIVAAAIGGYYYFSNSKKSTAVTKADVVTAVELKQAINEDDLSTASFIYNGIADTTNEDGSKEYHIAYNSIVKAGISMGDVKFDVDDSAKTIKITLPAISINSVEIDPDKLSYLPENPNLELQDILSTCKEDAINEANNSTKLMDLAETNLKNVIEAMLKPITSSKGYTITWTSTQALGN